VEAEQPAGAGDCGGVIERAEDVHSRPRQEREEKDVALERRLGATVDRHETLVTDGRACDVHGERDRQLSSNGDREFFDEVVLRHRQEDVNRSAAGEAGFEGVLVLDPVAPQARRSAVEDRPRFLVEGRLDAAAREGPRDVPSLRNGHRRTGITRRRALRADKGREHHPLLFVGPALDRLEDLSHAGEDTPAPALAGPESVLRLPLIEGSPRGKVGSQPLEPRVELAPELDGAGQAEPVAVRDVGIAALNAHHRLNARDYPPDTPSRRPSRRFSQARF
jgi:hypothetical protein